MNPTILVLRKPYQNEDALQNVVSYAVESVFADFDEILATENIRIDQECHIIEDMLAVQQGVPMENHRRVHHLVLTMPFCNAMQRTLTTGAEYAIEYFQQLGFQAIAVPHYGSKNHYYQFHIHIAVNSISFIDSRRLLDKGETWKGLRDYVQKRMYIFEWKLRYKYK